MVMLERKNMIIILDNASWLISYVEQKLWSL